LLLCNAIGGGRFRLSSPRRHGEKITTLFCRSFAFACWVASATNRNVGREAPEILAFSPP